MSFPPMAASTITTTAPMIFLSYRRDDSAGHVGRLYDALSAKFGAQRIFVDIDHISPGQDFVQVVDEAVARCAVLLVVIGKRWAGSGRVGKRRVDDPGDFVRLEVAGGLARQGLRVIPVLVGGATMPGPAELPDNIKDLARRNAIELSDTRWREDVARLITELDRALGPALTPREPSPARPRSITVPVALPAGLPATLRPWMKWSAGAVAVLLAALIVRGAVAGRGGTTTPAAVTVAPAQVTIAPDPPKPLPAQIERAGESTLSDARRAWRPDAMLTQITARLQSTSAPSGPYEIDYYFRSPTDGAGLEIVTNTPAGATSKHLAAAGGAALQPLAPGFVDLPAAVRTARDSGLQGDVRLAIVSAGFGGRLGKPTWLLKGTAGDETRSFFVDGTTGALLHGSFGMPGAGATAGGASSRHQNPIQAFKGLFHKH